jgi:hypothetical protein
MPCGWPFRGEGLGVAGKCLPSESKGTWRTAELTLRVLGSFASEVLMLNVRGDLTRKCDCLDQCLPCKARIADMCR